MYDVLMKTIYSIIFFCFASSLHAEVNLLSMMSESEKKATGLNTLNFGEIQALNTWIDEHFIVRPQQSATEKTLYLSVNLQNGAVLELSDGSKWEVAPDNRSTSSLWLTPFPLRIEPGLNAQAPYPFILLNLNTQEKVKVKRIAPASSSEAIQSNVPIK
jgi:hypothetical protein